MKLAATLARTRPIHSIRVTSVSCGRYARDKHRTVVESITSTERVAISASSSASSSAPGQEASTNSRKLRLGEPAVGTRSNSKASPYAPANPVCVCQTVSTLPIWSTDTAVGRPCGPPLRAVSRSALTSDFGRPATTARRASVAGLFCSANCASRACMYVPRTAPAISLAEIPCSKAMRISGRITAANTFKTASFCPADLFILLHCFPLHKARHLKDLCQLKIYDSGKMNAPTLGARAAAQNPSETAGYGTDPRPTGILGAGLDGPRRPGRLNTQSR